MVLTLGFRLNLLAIVLASALPSVAITGLLFPLWSWIQASTGIESVGHSGPAEWSYLAISFVVITGALLILFTSIGVREIVLTI